MSIKGFKAKDGTKHQYDYEALTNKPGNAGLYYTPVVTQPSDSTMQIAFEPSVSGAPTPDPVVVELPVGSGGSGENANGGLNDTAKNLLITILRSGVYSTDQSANITALEAALTSSGESGGGEEPPETPESGVTDNGRTLVITGGVTVTEDGDTLRFA